MFIQKMQKHWTVKETRDGLPLAEAIKMMLKTKRTSGIKGTKGTMATKGTKDIKRTKKNERNKGTKKIKGLKGEHMTTSVSFY